MVLMLPEGDDAQFFVLTHEYGEGRPFFSLNSWDVDRNIADIEADSGTVPDEVMSAVTRGIPIPLPGPPDVSRTAKLLASDYERVFGTTQG